MARAKWLDFQGKRILFVDFSNTDLTGVAQAIEEAKPIIRQQAPFSLLCLVNASGTKFSLEISDLIKNFTLHNKPFMKMTAAIGVIGIAKVVLNTAIVFSKRDNLILKNSEHEALEFLSRTQ